MSSNLSTGAQIFRVIFLILTGLFLCLGIVLLGVGIYLQVESQNYSFITGSDYVSGAVLLIVSGIVTLIISAVGFLGACFKNRVLLAIYAIVLALIIIFEIVAGIIGFVFSDTTAEESEDTYRDRLGRAIEEFDTNDDARTALDSLQNALSCCGVDSPSDWSRNGQFIWDNEQQLPESCQCNAREDEDCGVVQPFYYNYTDSEGNRFLVQYNSTNDVWSEGCFNSTVDFFIGFALVWGGLGIAFGILEVIGIIIALGLICCITCGKEEKEYV